MNNYTDQIIKLMRSNLKLIIDSNTSNIENEPLLGKKFNLMPFDLAYLLLEVEKLFNITISEEYIINHGLKTIADFSDYIGGGHDQ